MNTPSSTSLTLAESPKPSPNTIKIFIKIKAGGTELLGNKSKCRLGMGSTVEDTPTTGGTHTHPSWPPSAKAFPYPPHTRSTWMHVARVLVQPSKKGLFL